MDKEKTSTELVNQDNQLMSIKSTELDKNIEYDEHLFKEYISLFKTVFRICINSPRIVHAIIKYSGVLDKENRSEIVICEKGLFEVLTTIGPAFANILISKLDAPHYSKSELMDSVRNRNYDMFRKTVRNSSCDLTTIERPCNILSHCIKFYNYLKTKGFMREDCVFDEDDFFELLDKGRDTIEAIFNHSIESVDVSSKAANTLAKEINEEDSEERSKVINQNVKLFSHLIEEFVPYFYAACIPFLGYSERKQIENHLQKIFPGTVYGEMSESTINEGMTLIVRKYTQFFPNVPTPDNMAQLENEPQLSSISLNSFLLGINASRGEIRLDINQPNELTDSNKDSSITIIEQQKDGSNGIETNEGELEDCDTDSRKECLTTTQRTKRIKYKVDGLANKGSAAKGENFQWSDDLKKWYEKHQKEFEEFVKYVAAEKGYIPNEQGQVNAFIRTITGKDIPRCDEKAKLNNNKRNDATRAMMYLIKKKIIIGNYSDVFSHFDVERPQQYKDDKEDTSWMGGYARDANEDFKKKVEEIFADFLEPQPRES